MTMPSSTSQSVFSEPRGMTTSSFGPFRQVMALVNRTGSAGIGRFDSAAWSAKFRPMAMNLRLPLTGTP